MYTTTNTLEGIEQRDLSLIHPSIILPPPGRRTVSECARERMVCRSANERFAGGHHQIKRGTSETVKSHARKRATDG